MSTGGFSPELVKSGRIHIYWDEKDPTERLALTSKGNLKADFETLINNGLVKVAADKDTLTIPVDFMGDINPDYEVVTQAEIGLSMPDLPWMTYENEKFELDVETIINRVTEVEFDESCRVRKNEKGLYDGLKMSHLDYFLRFSVTVLFKFGRMHLWQVRI